MKPALLTVVCPLDNDVIYDMLVYYYNIGIRDFYVMLHKPDELLDDLIYKFVDNIKEVNLKVFYNRTNEHYHDRDLKVLSDAARQDGCDWLIASDADELLVLKKHKSIQEFLNPFKDKNNKHGFYQLLFKWYEYRTFENVYNDAFKTITHREPIARQQTKCIGKLNDKMYFVPGAHYIANHKESIFTSEDEVFYAHFSDRNEKQYCDKMRLQAVNWHNRYGAYTHWAEKLIEDDPQGLEKLWNTMLEQNKSNSNLIKDEV